MKAEVTAEERRWRAGEELSFTVKASHLFEAPAAKRRVEARCEFISSAFEHPDWRDYRFYDNRNRFTPVRRKLEESRLDE